MEIREEDLDVQVCPMCRGERLVVQEEGSRMMRISRQVECPECEGRGVSLTPTGAKLFDFVHRAMRFTSYKP